VVSRHGCAPAMPSWIELEHFLAHGSPTPRLREDVQLERIHRATTRTRRWDSLAVLAFDHRSQLEEVARQHGASIERIATFKALVADAAQRGYAAAQRAVGDAAAMPSHGVIVDGRFGGALLPKLTGHGAWVARPVEVPGSRPLAFEAGDALWAELRAWPAEHVVKCLLAHHPDDAAALAAQQMQALATLARACHVTGHELLVEVIPPSDKRADTRTLARALAQVYAAAVFPDWWKLPPPDGSSAWHEIAAVIDAHDPHCRGVLLLGLGAAEAELTESFRAAAAQPLCKGFAIGRSIFADAAAGWFAGALDDNGVIEQVASRYQRLIERWCEARAGTSKAI
jgi:5-dehydro-2-deoxygluconokinase